MRCLVKSLCVSIMFVLVYSVTAQAQGIATGSGEVTANLGFSSVKGTDNGRHPFFGFSGAYNVAPFAAVGFEYNYHPLGSVSDSGFTGSEHMQLLGPVVRFSLPQATRVVPYFLVDGGYVSDHASVSGQGVSIGATRSGGYFGLGGGASIYAGNNWGVRPEFRYDREHFGATNVQGVSIASSGQNDVQFSGAIFYQFGGKRSMKKK
ncbi:MAG TPA: outer membrane beta-barrel protein [Acidobacteriaceae bacterium]|nr:outer membrane beta-barrel protein [Acidobacteriaceae bacterium]